MTVAVVGVGGTGSHVTQQLVYLGVGVVGLIDDEELDETNLNRYVTARHDDPIPGSPKTRLGSRLGAQANPEVKIVAIQDTLISAEAFDFIKAADAVFGCVDNDGVRFVLNELCCAYECPYFDIASGIPTPDDYGGRVCSIVDGEGCLVCWEELDQDEIDKYLSSFDQRAARDGAYGVPREDLGGSGPSVISINGVVASLGVTEFLVWATGIRPPVRRLMYRANRGIVTRPTDAPQDDCYYCKSVRGQGDAADVRRYLSSR